MTENNNIITVLQHRLPEAIQSLTKLVRKAERYGLQPVTWTIGAPYPETYRNADGRKITMNYVDITLCNIEAPKVGDFSFVAKVEITTEGVIIDSIPGEVLPTYIRENLADGSCEHCNINRFRKYLYLVRDVTGNLVQVGHTCLRDYMGTDTPKSVTARFRWEREFREFRGEGWGTIVDSAEELLAVTATAIRLWGWVAKSAPESAGEPTAYRVGCWFSTFNTKDSLADKDCALLRANITDADWDLARETMDWVTSDKAGDSDYIENLRVILAPRAVEAKRRGYACSAISAYQRFLSKELGKKEAQSSNPDSNFVGTVGTRIRGMIVRCESSRVIQNEWGGSVLYRLTDLKGNIFTWFSSAGNKMNIGEEYIVDLTVKGHKVYNNVKETQLTV